MNPVKTINDFIETLPADEFYVPIPDEVFTALESLGVDTYNDPRVARDFLHVVGSPGGFSSQTALERDLIMSAIKLEAYLGGHSLEQARDQARRLSEIDQCPMFVNIKAHRRPGTSEYIVSFAVSIWAGEEVEAIFVNGREQTL